MQRRRGGRGTPETTERALHTNVIKALHDIVPQRVLKEWGVAGSVYSLAAEHLHAHGMALYHPVCGGRNKVSLDLLRAIRSHVMTDVRTYTT